MSIQKLSINTNRFRGDIYTISETLSTHKNYIEKQIACLSAEKDFGPTLLIAAKAVKADLTARKEILEARLLVLNGNHYEDPNSEIHKAYLLGPSGQPKLNSLLAERDKIKNELEQVDQELIRNKALHSFLKIIKIDAELLDLSGHHYGDENGLLDKAYQAYKKGTGSLETYRQLEEKRKSLSEKKVTLQSFCSGISISDVLKNRPYFIQHFELQYREALETIAFLKGLVKWCAEVDQQGSRINAATQIFKCYVTKGTRLDLIAQGLTSLPPEIGQLGSLQWLYLSDNRLQALPPEIGQLGNLEELNVSYNELQALPPEIGQLGSLQWLYLSDNRLQALPPEIGQLGNLRGLKLLSNQLRVLPPEIGQLGSLQELHVAINRLQALPPEIGQLGNLRELSVYHNRLQSLPPEMGQLRSLQELKVADNQLQALPPEMGQLGNLQWLNVSGNELQALPSSLARLASNCIIRAPQNRFSYGATRSFQAQIDHHRALNPALGPTFEYSIHDHDPLSDDNSTLEEMIGFWITQFRANFSENNPNCKDFSMEIFDLEHFATNAFYKPLRDLKQSKANDLKSFLIRLKGTEDFKHASSCQPLILNVARMLQGACTNPDFKQKLSLILEDALSTCGDRVANALNMIYLQWEFLCGSGTLGLDKLATIVLQAMRLEIVEGLAREIIKEKNLGDHIETILYFKVKLKDALGLPVVTKGMLYPGASGVTQEELNEVSKIVLKKTSPDHLVEILILSDEWKARLIEENRELFQAMNEDITGKQNEVFDQKHLTATQRNSEIERVTKEGDEAVIKLLIELTCNWIKDCPLAR